jgi:hypothetical protein
VGAVRHPSLRPEDERQEVVDQHEDAEHETRRQLDDVDEQGEQEDIGAHAVVGKPDEVQAEHAGDRPRRADRRQVGPHPDEGVPEPRNPPGAEIDEQVEEPSEPVLDVVAVDPQEQHVPGEVHQSAVQEHRREQAGDGRGGGMEAVPEDEQVVRAHPLRHHADLRYRQAAVGGDRLQVGGERRVVGIGLLERQRQEPQVDRDVERDERPRDDRSPGRVRTVADGEKHARRLYRTADLANTRGVWAVRRRAAFLSARCPRA